MMKIELTRKWKLKPHGSQSSSAGWKGVYLLCYHCVGLPDRWVGMAALGAVHELTGPNRKSPAAARQDAERLAVELLLDIRDGTKALMAEYGVDADLDG